VASLVNGLLVKPNSLHKSTKPVVVATPVPKPLKQKSLSQWTKEEWGTSQSGLALKVLRLLVNATYLRKPDKPLLAEEYKKTSEAKRKGVLLKVSSLWN